MNVSQLDLSSNGLCGLDRRGRGTYTAEGITAIADALRVNGSLTKLSLADNFWGEEGTKAICEALEQNTTLKELDISGHPLRSNMGGSASAKHVAKMVLVNGGLTALDLSFNNLKDEGVGAICEAIQSNKKTKLASLNMGQNSIGPVGAKSVAAMLAVTCTLIECNLSNNDMGEEGKASIRFAVQGKAGFHLHL
jgi:Ran GTPase-activating protein (RanGAP) involved in mRNA processing and transport